MMKLDVLDSIALQIGKPERLKSDILICTNTSQFVSPDMNPDLLLNSTMVVENKAALLDISSPISDTKNLATVGTV